MFPKGFGSWQICWIQTEMFFFWWLSRIALLSLTFCLRKWNRLMQLNVKLVVIVVVLRGIRKSGILLAVHYGCPYWQVIWLSNEKHLACFCGRLDILKNVHYWAHLTHILSILGSHRPLAPNCVVVLYAAIHGIGDWSPTSPRSRLRTRTGAVACGHRRLLVALINSEASQMRVFPK